MIFCRHITPRVLARQVLAGEHDRAVSNKSNSKPKTSFVSSTSPHYEKSNASDDSENSHNGHPV